MNVNRDKIVEDLGQVYEFLKQIDDPYRDSVALAAGLISGEISEAPAAARLRSLGEVRVWKDFLWIEFKGKAPKIAVVDDFPFDEGALRIYTARDLIMLLALNYGRTFRCWADKPREVDMEGAEWEKPWEEVDGDA